MLASADPRAQHHAMHPSGEFAARLMIVALLAAPLGILLRGWRGPRWLVRNRRAFGVAAFGYAALHLTFYLVDSGTVAQVLTGLAGPRDPLGWLALAVFVPLAATSNDWSVRRLARSWKSLQRATYAAAVLVAVPWAVTDRGWEIGPMLVHFGPLLAIEA